MRRSLLRFRAVGAPICYQITRDYDRTNNVSRCNLSVYRGLSTASANNYPDQILVTNEFSQDQIRAMRENGQMKRRYLYEPLLRLSLDRNKMAFVSRPRQVGKTTLAKSYKGVFEGFQYKNWDEVSFRRQWLKSPASWLPEVLIVRFRGAIRFLD